MIAAPLSPHALVKSLEDASLALQDAHIALAGAVAAHGEAKRTLELSRAKLLVKGVDGKNEAQREAQMRLELSPLYDAVLEVEAALTEARCALDCARLDWDLARYTVRTMELGQ